MSQEKNSQPKQPKAAKPQGPQGQGQAQAEVSHCKFDGCKSKPKKFGFCMEHFEMYMAGVVRGDGKKPIDYEEKLALFQKNKQGQRKVA